MVPEISVVLPTRDRLDVLPEVLLALDRQVEAPPFEVIVVDDGSEPATGRLLREHRPSRYQLRTLRQESLGPAAARNAGVQSARGERVAFLGDDTVPEAGWLAAHAAAHRAQAAGTAVLGYTAWHPRMRRTRFLDYINDHGLQFGYALIEDPANVPFNFFYTSNVSLARRWLLEEPFDLRFPYPAWEDIELSYRLFAKGLRLIYEPRARTAHDHPTSFRRFTARQEKAGYSAVVFFRLHPELGGFLGLSEAGPPPLPSGAAQWVREAVVYLLQGLPVSLPGWWDEALRYHYIRGLHRGWRELHGASTQPALAAAEPRSAEEGVGHVQ